MGIREGAEVVDGKKKREATFRHCIKGLIHQANRPSQATPSWS